MCGWTLAHWPRGEGAMNDQQVIVVGGSSGVGEANARLFLARGMDVVIAGRAPTKLERALDRLGGRSMRVIDTTIPDRVARLFAAIGPFDHLVLSLSGGGDGGPSPALEAAASIESEHEQLHESGRRCWSRRRPRRTVIPCPSRRCIRAWLCRRPRSIRPLTRSREQG
jgi:hypothetical protein